MEHYNALYNYNYEVFEPSFVETKVGIMIIVCLRAPTLVRI